MPIRVRWRPFTYWAAWRWFGHPFEATYTDATGETHQARFWTSQWNPKARRIAPEKGYMQKPLPWLGQIIFLSLAALCIGFGVMLLLVHDLRPWRYRLQGWPENLLAAAVICFAGAILPHIAYHYSRRTDERGHRLVARAFSAASGVLFFLSLVAGFYQMCTK